ncbi:MAG: tetratricopeptide repeat protein [Archangiaceae bacterium]|nr:tetratricopeptide repeat protein [Archangiaceae bacterium]
MTDREAMFVQMTQEFPDSPMGHFSLGKFLLEEKRFPESVLALEKAVALDPNYAAAWVALGDAHAGAQDALRAKAAWERALGTPHGKRDQSLQADLEQRMAEL